MIKENFLVSDHEVRTKVRSGVKWGWEHHVVSGFKCPCCGHIGREIDHGQTDNCQRCGLRMTVWGNRLECVDND
jgi:hypothetical protein